MPRGRSGYERSGYLERPSSVSDYPARASLLPHHFSAKIFPARSALVRLNCAEYSLIQPFAKASGNHQQHERSQAEQRMERVENAGDRP